MKPRQRRRSNNFRTHPPHPLKTETQRSLKPQTHHRIRGKKEGKKKKKNRTHDFFLATSASASDPKTNLEIKTLRPKVPLSAGLQEYCNSQIPQCLHTFPSLQTLSLCFGFSSFFLSDFFSIFSISISIYISLSCISSEDLTNATDNPQQTILAAAEAAAEERGREGKEQDDGEGAHGWLPSAGFRSSTGPRTSIQVPNGF